MADYISVPIDEDPIDVEERVYDYVREVWPDWRPKEPHLATVLTEAYAQEVSDLKRLATDVPPEIFRFFGRLAGVEPEAAGAATGVVAFTMVDADGYTVPAGTTVRMLVGGEDFEYFDTVEEVSTVPAGPLFVEVGIRAQTEGTEANNLSTQPELVDILDYIDSVTVNDATGGGTDAEDIDLFLNRLSARMRLLADRVILPRDAELYVAQIPGISRVLAVDGYDPTNNTEDNERMLTVYALDNVGNSIAGTPLEGTVAAMLATTREATFVFHVGDTDDTDVAVAVTFTPYPGFDVPSVEAAAEEAIMAFLNRVRWGQPAYADADLLWYNETKVRVNEIVSLVDNVAGVNHVLAVTINGVAADFDLPGRVPLPGAGSTASALAV